MNFKHPVTGLDSNVPWTKDESNAYGYARYMDDQGCKICGTEHVGRYVADNTCVVCAMRDASEVWKLWKMGSPDRPEIFPTSAAEAVQKGVDYFYREQLCKGGPHFMQPNLKTGKCVACGKAKGQQSTDLATLFPDMVLSKDEAAAVGSATYRTGLPCRRGHTGWRYVSSGACIACMRSQPVQQYREHVDLSRLITVAEQMQLFIGYAWDGRRIIDPDGRKYSIGQFNIAVGGVGRYEVSGGRPEVFTSHEAFMLNFGPMRQGAVQAT